MKMVETSIASAITVSDPEAEPTLSPGISSSSKRRQNETPEYDDRQDNKRQRLSPGKRSSLPNATNNLEERETDRNAPSAEEPSRGDQSYNRDSDRLPDESRRKSSNAADEKQRSKRLFGALLGSLNSHPKEGGIVKRRQEIEDRRKAELRRQDERDAQNNQRKLQRLAEQRARLQERVDEYNRRIRHNSMLDSARYLQTLAEPPLYYRPWDLRPDEEGRIDEQIKDARAKIDNELEEINSYQQDDAADQIIAPTGANASRSGKANDDRDDHDQENSAEVGDSIDLHTDGENDKGIQERSDKSAANVGDRHDVPMQSLTSINVQHEDTLNRDPPDQDGPNHRKLDDVEDEGDQVVDGDEDTVIY